MAKPEQNQYVGELDADAAIRYIAQRKGLAPAEIRAFELGGGVSNHVILVEAPESTLVLKQSLPKLRVKEDWFSDQRRIFQEAEAINRLASVLPPNSVPTVLFVDRERFAFAMTAAPKDAVPWKNQLLSGVVSGETAATVAHIHGRLIGGTWKNDEFFRAFDDLAVFEQLRLNPYYEFTATRHPGLADRFAQAADRCRTRRVCLVHGDWSPKNLMVSQSSVMAIDFEVIHFGDPTFDTAFLINHLVLKSFYRPELRDCYRRIAARYWIELTAVLPSEAPSLESGTLLHLPLLMLARVDGKSPAEYITAEPLKQAIRRCATGLLERAPCGLDDVFLRIAG